MKLIDNAAAVAAIRHYGSKSVTSCVLGLSFETPVKVGDVLEATATVAYTYRNRMIINVKVSRENPSDRQKSSVSEAWLIFVGIEQDGKDAEPVTPSTTEETLLNVQGKEWYAKKISEKIRGILSIEEKIM